MYYHYTESGERFVYSPHALDGWLIVGKHRTFLPFPSYVVRLHC